MKKNSSLIILLITLAMVITGYFTFQKYLAPLYANNVGQNHTVELKVDKKISFGKISGQENIFGIELEITGKTNSNFGINISNDESLVHNARIKGGDKVDFIYKAEWYSDSLFIDFDTKSEEKGYLEIEVRFLGIK